MQPMRVHILGASGSGTTTLGAALASTVSCPHHDVDSYFWMPTNPPFEMLRPREERIPLLNASLAVSESWVLSGSLCGWGDVFIERFSLVVFLWLPPEIRVGRLHAREVLRYGQIAIEERGARRQQYCEFMQWAMNYDQGDLSMRSRQRHESWLAALPCPVVRLEGDLSTEAQLRIIRSHLSVPRVS